MARACLKCGHENPDDVDFCEQCGEYVRWELSGVRQAVPAPPPAAPAAPPAAQPQPSAPPETPVAAPPPAQAPPPPPPAPSPPPAVEPAAAPPAQVASPQAADGVAYEFAPAPEPVPEPAPDAVVVTMRPPEDESATGGEVSGRVEACSTTTLVALVRNQSGSVDNYDFHVEGLPDGGWTISPST